MTKPPPDTRDEKPRSEADRGVSGRAFELHFTPKEVAKLWHRDEDTIRRLFRNEPGVLRLESPNRRKGTRRYVSLSIPESVVARVHQRLEVQEQTSRMPRIAKARATQATRNTQSAPLGNGIPRARDDQPSDEQWEREVARIAGTLKYRIREDSD